jgi:hypothetical protein
MSDAAAVGHLVTHSYFQEDITPLQIFSRATDPSYALGLPDYNGPYGIGELCDVCPLSQLDLCRSAHRADQGASAKH